MEAYTEDNLKCYSLWYIFCLSGLVVTTWVFLIQQSIAWHIYATSLNKLQDVTKIFKNLSQFGFDWQSSISNNSRSSQSYHENQAEVQAD